MTPSISTFPISNKKTGSTNSLNRLLAIRARPGIMGAYSDLADNDAVIASFFGEDKIQHGRQLLDYIAVQHIDTTTNKFDQYIDTTIYMFDLNTFLS